MGKTAWVWDEKESTGLGPKREDVNVMRKREQKRNCLERGGGRENITGEGECQQHAVQLCGRQSPKSECCEVVSPPENCKSTVCEGLLPQKVVFTIWDPPAPVDNPDGGVMIITHYQ